MSDRPSVPVRATYRVQLHKGFTFRDAETIVDYIADLGFSHLYGSPIMQARPGSTHGYDIVDHNTINPEIGTEAEFDQLVDRLHGRNMGLLLDIVPNHMGIGPDNNRWLDLLEWGELSPYAGFFDIDWRPPHKRSEGKVLLPVLGDQFGRVLANGEFVLGFDAGQGGFAVRYNSQIFPISPFDYSSLLKSAAGLAGDARDRLNEVAEQFKSLGRLKNDISQLRQRSDAAKSALALMAADNPQIAAAIERVMAEFVGRPDDAASWVPLGRLLDQQNYRPAYWRVASDEINYRRFFDINELGGVRVELQEIFEQTHRKTFRLLEDGKIDGLRIDHIDGLFDPKEYVERLQARGGGAERRVYVLVEKILAHYEELRDDWPVAGTTGYDTINQFAGLFNDPAGERPLTIFYRRFSGRRESFDEILYRSKLHILRVNLASEVGVLANEMHRVSSKHWNSRDFTLNSMRGALEEVIAHFPVYRTYVDRGGAVAADRRYIDWALGVARKRSGQTDTTIYDFLHGVLTGDLAEDGDYPRGEITFLAMRFQQLSGPAMAKGLEDTSFYRYFRHLALNEVGGDPRRFFVTQAGFHRTNETRLKRHPLDMLAGSTHDTKRGEDARARLVCLTGMTDEWRRRVMMWQRFNRRLKSEIDGAAAPDRNDEYYFYQSLAGCWPLELTPDDADGLSALAERMVEALLKAVREAKEKTSWGNPGEAYEQALIGFVKGALDGARAKLFLNDFFGFFGRLARLGALTSVSQTLLRLTMPGVPDIYRGSELWDFSLVDPDNRRPVDYGAYRARLAELEEYREPSVETARTIAGQWAAGLPKLAVIQRTLKLREALPELFSGGEYQALTATGVGADKLVAFARVSAETALVAVAPRFWPALLIGDSDQVAWQDTELSLPAGVYTDSFTGQPWMGETPVPIADLLAHFPVSLLVRHAA